MPKLMVVIASTRPVRAGLPVGQWIHGRAAAHPAFEVDLVDLAELDLPFMNEPHHPRLRRYTLPHTMAWSARVEAADAFVMVTPEYNHGYSAPLKNAIDYLVHEWAYKPVGMVAYGGVTGGTRAVQQLKQVLVGLKMTPLLEAVYVPFVVQHIDEERRFRPTEELETAAGLMLDELARWTGALATLRSPA